jgi:hypothetical protein
VTPPSLFGAVNAGLLGPVEELVARWRPDVVVYEPLACAAAVARHSVPDPADVAAAVLAGVRS